jgi:signal transduction histidine kinase
LRRLIRAATHAGIVANVLSLHAMEEGECRITLAPYSVRHMVTNVLSVCRMSLAHSAASRMVCTDEASLLPALVVGDGDRTSQIVLNLLTSTHARAAGACFSARLADTLTRYACVFCSTDAAKFADGTDVTVSARCEPAESASAAADGGAAYTLTLVVSDGGRGLCPEECVRIFEPYYRSPTHKGGGTGLGLWVCKRFAEGAHVVARAHTDARCR